MVEKTDLQIEVEKLQREAIAGIKVLTLHYIEEGFDKVAYDNELHRAMTVIPTDISYKEESKYKENVHELYEEVKDKLKSSPAKNKTERMYVSRDTLQFITDYEW